MSLRAQRSNLVAASTNAVASFRLPPMSLRAQRGNLAAASTNAVASFRLSPNVIASAARQSRSHIDQRCRQHSIAPKCHCERSAAIPQRHRPKSVTPAPSIIGSLPNILYPVRQSGWRNERSSRPCPTHHLEQGKGFQVPRPTSSVSATLSRVRRRSIPRTGARSTAGVTTAPCRAIPH